MLKRWGWMLNFIVEAVWSDTSSTCLFCRSNDGKLAKLTQSRPVVLDYVLINVYYPEEEVLAVDDSWTVLTPVRNLWRSENVKHISTRAKKQKSRTDFSALYSLLTFIVRVLWHEDFISNLEILSKVDKRGSEVIPFCHLSLTQDVSFCSPFFSSTHVLLLLLFSVLISED